MTDKKTYRLGSSEMANSHGMVRWAINGYHFPRDRKQLIKVIADSWSIPPDAAKALLAETVPFKVEGTEEMPVVVFEVAL
jgi:hypothetical protein